MATNLVSINIPQTLYRCLERTATRLQKPVESFLIETLQAALPVVDEIPSHIEAEVAALDHLSNAALKEAAQSDMTLEAQQAFEQLLDLQTLQPLTEGEEARLGQLRTEYGRVLSRKARALALLAERGQALISE
jgi:hypothetical protein